LAVAVAAAATTSAEMEATWAFTDAMMASSVLLVDCAYAMALRPETTKVEVLMVMVWKCRVGERMD
jgi:hypothetical protein